MSFTSRFQLCVQNYFKSLARKDLRQFFSLKTDHHVITMVSIMKCFYVMPKIQRAINRIYRGGFFFLHFKLEKKWINFTQYI